MLFEGTFVVNLTELNKTRILPIYVQPLKICNLEVKFILLAENA